MAIRFAFTWSIAWILAAILPTLGCTPQQGPPAESAASAGSDEHEHEHADDEHAHTHADEHDHAHEHEHADDEHDHPETYAAAVAELDKLRGAIETASADDDLARADSEVHAIGHLLEEVGKLADKEPFSDDDKAKIKAAVEGLMDAFEQVDAKIHDGKGKSYADIADEIDAAMSILKARVTKE